MKKMLNLLIIGLFIVNIFVVIPQTNSLTGISTENINEIDEKERKIDSDFQEKKFENIPPGSDEKNSEIPVSSNSQINSIRPSIKSQSNLQVGESIKVDFSSVNKTTKEISSSEYLGTQFTGNMSESKLECPATFGGDNIVSCAAFIDSYDVYIYVLKYFDTDAPFGGATYLYLYEFLTNGSFVKEIDLSAIISTSDTIHSLNVNNLHVTFQKTALHYYYDRSDFAFDKTVATTDGFFEMDENYVYSEFSDAFFDHYLRIRDYYTLALVQDVLVYSTAIGSFAYVQDMAQDEFYVYIATYNIVDSSFNRIYKVLKESPYTVSLLMNLEFRANKITVNEQNEELFTLNSSDNTIRVFDLEGNYIKEFQLNGSIFGFYQNFQDFTFLTSWNEETWFTKNLFILDYQNFDVSTAWENVFIWEFEREISTQLFNQENLNFDDSKESLFWSRTTGLFVEFSARISFVIYDIANPDNLGIDFRLLKLINSSSTEIFTSQYLTLSGISGSYSSSEVIITILYGYTSAFSYVNVSFFDTGSNQEITSGITTIDSILTVQEMKMYIDYLYVEREGFSSQIRTKYEYKDNNNFIHFLPVQNYEYRMNFTVNTPTYLEFSNIEPYAPNQLIGYNYVFYDTLPVNYEIELQSGSGKGLDYARQKQIVAISDVTTDYFQDSSFENSYNDWSDYSASYLWASKSLNYTIVSDGISSMRLENTVSQRSILQLNYDKTLITGDYYISFDYYYETALSGDLIFYFYNSDPTWKQIDTDESILNRWQSINFFVDYRPLTETNSYFRIDTVGNFQGVIFIDNFKINQVNTVVETTGSSETTIQSQFNFWTDKGLFPAINENVTLQYRDRTANTLIDSYSAYTDSNGIISWKWLGKPEAKEIELRSIAWNNYFVSGFSEENMKQISPERVSSTYWKLMSGAGYINSYDFSEKAVVIDANIVSSTALDYRYYPASNYDLSNVDYFLLEYKVNDTTNNPYSDYFTLRTGVSDYIVWYSADYFETTVDDAILTTYQKYGFDMDSGNIVGNYNGENVDFLDFRIRAGVSFSVKLNVRNFHFIQAQKYYFTPNTVGFTDYAEKELLDSWDWSEGDLENFIPYDNAPTITVNNGYINDTKTDNALPYETMAIWRVIDTSYYNSIIFRVKPSRIPTAIFMNAYNGSAWLTQNVFYNIVANWQVLTFDIGTLWTNQIITLFKIGVDWSSGTGINQTFYDSIQFVHQDSSLDSGFNYEFNQNNYLEGFTTCGSLSQQSYYLHVISYGGGCGANSGYFGRAIPIGDTILIRLRSSNSNPVNLWIVGNAGNNLIGTPIVTSEWVTYKYILGVAISDIYLLILTVSGAFDIDFIRFGKDSSPNLYENSEYFVLDNEVQTNYNIWIDNQYLGIYSSWEYIPKNFTVGTHTIRYQAFLSELDSFNLPSAVYEYEYIITESDWMKITIHDQSGKIIDFDSTKSFIESIRLFDNYAYFGDTSQTFNLTITDIFDNILYQNLVETFEQFKEIQITLYSTKIMNIQPNPVFLYITRGLKVFSEWILPNEIVKYYFESDSYNFTIVYSNDISGGFGATTTNSTVVTFIYAITADTALIITGYSIQDVFNNLISLQNDINSVNTTLNYNRENFTLQFSATNQNVTILINDSSFIIDTINSNFTSIQSNFTAIINALNSNFTSISSNFTAIIDNIAQLLGLFRVHFSIVDTLGIGLPFETALLTLNDTRQLDSDIYLSNNSFVRIKAFDYFNTLLFEENYTITETNQNINVSMTLYEMIAFNNGSYTSYVEIYKNGLLGLNVTIPIGNAISFRLTEGNYDYKVYYFESETQKTLVNDPSLYNYDRKLVNVGKIAVSAEFPSKLDFSSPTIKIDALAVSLDKIDYWGIFLEITKATIYFTAGYFVTNFFLRRAIGRHAQDTAYVKPKNKRDWLDQTETKLGFKTDDKDLW